MIQCSKENRERIRTGDTHRLVDVLTKEHKKVLASLKTQKDDLRFIQGQMVVLDNILELISEGTP